MATTMPPKDETLARAERAYEAARAAVTRGERGVSPTVPLLRLLAAQYLTGGAR
jgi:hypothetical protein